MASFVWMATAGIIAKDMELEPEPSDPNLHRDKQWPVHLAMLGVLAAPLSRAFGTCCSVPRRPP